MQSAAELRQGDPIDPAFFLLSTGPPGYQLVNICYLDDATLGGTVENVLADLSGLAISDGKCELILLNQER